jgi:hypothetical protein
MNQSQSHQRFMQYLEEVKCCICGKNADYPDYAPDEFYWITVRPFRRIPPRHWYDYDNSTKIFCKDCISPVVCLAPRPAQVVRANSQGFPVKVKWK